MRLLLCSLAFVLSVYAGAAHAAAPPVTYATPSLENLTDFLFANGYIDVSDPDQLSDYVIVKDCTLYQKYYNDDFAWNKIKTRITEQSKTLQKDVVSHYVMPADFSLSRYNFTTKAFDLTADSRMDNVNTLYLWQNATVNCQSIQVIQAMKRTLPYINTLKLDQPASLYRLPMSQGMAQKILPDLIKGVGEVALKSRKVYGLVYFTIDSVLGKTGSQAVLLGRMDKVEFYLDPERTQKFKTLVYSEF